MVSPLLMELHEFLYMTPGTPVLALVTQCPACTCETVNHKIGKAIGPKQVCSTQQVKADNYESIYDQAA